MGGKLTSAVNQLARVASRRTTRVGNDNHAAAPVMNHDAVGLRIGPKFDQAIGQS